ncbi:hypothetical protein FOL46_005056, partial [Perkinsus olseni]
PEDIERMLLNATEGRVRTKTGYEMTYGVLRPDLAVKQAIAEAGSPQIRKTKKPDGGNLAVSVAQPYSNMISALKCFHIHLVEQRLSDVVLSPVDSVIAEARSIISSALIP